MSTHKSTVLRYRIIDKSLRSRGKKHWSVQELIDKMSEYDIFIKRRTLLFDIDQMKFEDRLGYHAPIEYCRKNKGYYYSDSEYSIEKVPLTDEEYKVLANSLSFLKHKSVFKDFESVIDKILRIGAQNTKNYDTTSIIDFEKAPYYKGEHFIDPIIHYIREKQPLKIFYQKFGNVEADEYLIHPYFLKEYRDRWYILCLHEELEEFRIFALDRIVSVEEAMLYFKECPLQNPAEYFRNILGVTVGKGPVEEIILTFSSDQAPYLKTQHLHHSQEILIDDIKEFRIRLKLIPNFELTSLILSYGKRVKVINPESLKEVIDKESR